MASLYFSTNVTCSVPLDIHSSPKEPTPEKRSSTFEFSNLKLTNGECSIILNIDSFNESLNGLVFLSLGNKIFFPLKFPEIILINLSPYIQYLFCKNHFSNLISLSN